MKKLLTPTLLFALFFMVGNLQADVTETVKKARSYLGSEQALNGLQSVKYIGQLETTELTPEGPVPVQAMIEIIFQKPRRQRITAHLPARTEVTALDEYEGWQRIEDPADPGRWRLTLMSTDQIRRLRANTWENLSFFRGLESLSGRLDDLGQVEIDGIQAHKIAFTHASDIIFFRYFDLSTGRLILTETEQGSRIREEGEIRAGGIRFPHKVITTNELPDGTERVVTVTFQQIVVNETFPASLFAVPPVSTP